MSVFTTITQPQLEAFLPAYQAGKLLSFKGIEAGITNTNYFVTTDTGNYVLTIVETENATDVEWFMQLQAFLHSRHIPCAMPLLCHHENYTATLADKPATLVQRLRGAEKANVDPSECHALGRHLAQMHLACQTFEPQRADSRGREWIDATAAQVLPLLNEDDQQLLAQELALSQTDPLQTLPCSVIHADLFRDNVLFDGSEITGIIDFYYACYGCMLYDIAITYNDWCRLTDGTVDALRGNALLDGYRAVRPWSNAEQTLWPVAQRCAALRFWLSRLQDYHFPPAGELTYTKDPSTLRDILTDIQSIT